MVTIKEIRTYSLATWYSDWRAVRAAATLDALADAWRAESEI